MTQEPKRQLNCVQCHECGDIILSKHRHDFRFCVCTNVAVDGGAAYIRRVYKKPDSWTEISTFEELGAALQKKKDDAAQP